MITVRLMGGARRSFGSDSLDIDRRDITVGELLDHVVSIKPQGMPDLDVENVLVAVNGADSSATGGRSTALRDGDVVSIIPVIHGGAQKRLLLDILGRHILAAGLRPAGPALLDGIRKRYPGLRVQAIHDRLVLNRYHLRGILRLSLGSERSGTMLARRLETDILMRFALSSQISAAIEEAGAGPGRRLVMIGIGPRRDLERLYGELLPDAAALFCGDNSAFVRRRFGITKRELASVRSKTPLEDLLCERAAVLL